jgi:elongation factor G
MPPDTPLAKIRNFGICAHIDAGKTTTTERILFYTGKEHAIGEVHEGSATMDYLAEEQERGITITAAATTIFWQDHQLNLIDTPGHVDFTAEADRYQVPRICFINKMDRGGADFDASCLSIQERLGAPTIPLTVPLGAADRFQGIVDLITMEFLTFEGNQGSVVRRQPIPADALEEMQLRRSDLLDGLAEYDDAIMERVLEDQEPTEAEIHAAVRKVVLGTKLFPVLAGTALRNAGIQPVIDAVVRYLPSPLDKGSVIGHLPDEPEEEILLPPDPKGPLCALAFKIISDSHGDLTFVRVYSGTLKQGKGVYNPRLGKHERGMRLLRMHANNREQIDSVSAGGIAAVVGFKETATGDTLCEKDHPVSLESIRFPEPVISMAIEPRSTADRDRLEDVLGRLAREDPTFRVSQDPETGQTIIAGMGELHLEVLKNRLLRDYQIEANVGRPRVSHRQTVKGMGKAEVTFERIIAGSEQRATVALSVQPGASGTGITFENKAAPGIFTPAYVAAIEEGVRFAANGGLDMGYPVIDVAATLLGGRVYEVESTEVSFQAAGGDAFRAACEAAGVAILEPIMHFVVTTPMDFVGPVSSDLIRRGALIEGDDLRGDLRAIHGTVALNEMFGYSTAVRSLSQGRAGYSMEPAGFAEVSATERKRLTFED